MRNGRTWSIIRVMRILLTTDGSDAELAALSGLLPHAEVVLAQPGGLGQRLELALRNALPGQEVVTVPLQTVVDSEEPTRPRAILGLRSLRTLIASGTLVICALGPASPVAIGPAGSMEPIEAEVGEESALELLARRLGARRMDVRERVAGLGYARPA